MLKILMKLVGPRAGQTCKIGYRKVPFKNGEFSFDLHPEQLKEYKKFFDIMEESYSTEVYIDGRIRNQKTQPAVVVGDGQKEESNQTKPVEWEEPEKGNEPEPEQEEGVSARIGSIVRAIEELQELGNEEDFNQNGCPKIAVIREKLGDDTIEVGELSEAWANF